ncbi:LodA/GoxA family CTQ-dependent oxidase [Ferrimonas pelagia]|uniref:LodA/GoxA family CTQ-dependent oxidase n=1 Tax=Ferrimonas pelagia TaxID=1177826 RepID=A0ABP9EXG2_9GAMM
MTDIIRIHPAINFARVGNSDEYLVSPETAAGDLQDPNTGLMGGLPTRPNDGSGPDQLIQSTDLRDSQGRLKRQAARFRLYHYDQAQNTYPAGGGTELTLGAQLPDGRTVTDILWTVHLANKKANNFEIENDQGEESGIEAYQDPSTLVLRNAVPPPPKPGEKPPVNPGRFVNDINDTTRLTALVIDPGPRAIKASSKGAAPQEFNQATPASFSKDGQIRSCNYPQTFPSQNLDTLPTVGNALISTLGGINTEAQSGRLLVLPGFGLTNGIATPQQNGPEALPPLEGAIDNNNWFDDVGDGPVNATVLFDDGSRIEAVAGWVVTTDPSYAPQTRNVVSTWDDVYDTWVQQLALQPELFRAGQFQSSYQPRFDSTVLPVFHAAMLQQWNTNLNSTAINGHLSVGAIKACDDPTQKIPNLKSLIRDPSSEAENSEGSMMPLSLGDSGKSFLSVSPTQYFLLNQWYGNRFQPGADPLGPGEKMDRAVLENGLGGRYSPGIELTFIVRDVNLYQQNWQGDSGPFRIKAQPMDYSNLPSKAPVLSAGYIPLGSAQVQPGDLSKFMALPWHCDYNSCGTHLPDPNPEKAGVTNNTLYWSWPGQRPFAVYPQAHCQYNPENERWYYGDQMFSIRGNQGQGTKTPLPQQQGRFQQYIDFVHSWQDVGFIIQGTQVPVSHDTLTPDPNIPCAPYPEGRGPDNYGAGIFIEVASHFSAKLDDSDKVVPWSEASSMTKPATTTAS